jgi:DNA-damage-inducible protein D
MKMTKKNNKENALVVFQGENVRRTWYDDQWWFVVVDLVKVLTDSVNPSDYLKKVRIRDEELNKGWGQIVTPLSIETTGGMQKLNCSNLERSFRIIQSIPSKKAEPFKLWLAKIGSERIEEIENPELAQDRSRKYYEMKGYPQDWIEKRMRGIAIRQDLTQEWKQRGIQENKEFAILTNEISQATFGVSIKEHKQIKSLDPKYKNQNLRDHMGDLELIFSMLGERLTTEATRNKDSQGFIENKEVAQESGKVAGRAREDAEKSLGVKVVSEKNYLDLTEKKSIKENLKPIK